MKRKDGENVIKQITVETSRTRKWIIERKQYSSKSKTGEE